MALTITAVCLNPCEDWTVWVDRLVPAGTNRVQSETSQPGGKGINVARNLAALGAPACAVGLIGTESAGWLFNALEESGVRTDFVRVPGKARRNLKIFDRPAGAITEVNAPGLFASAPALAGVADAALRRAKESRFLVLTGSLPPGCPPEYYGDLAARARRAAPECSVALDAEGEAFARGVRQAPFFVKPNLHELSLYAGRPLSSRAEILAAAQSLLDAGVGAVLVSMGPDGALYVDRGHRLFAQAVPVEVRTTVGAGDAMVAGFLSATAEGEAPSGAFARAVACAAASVAGDIAGYTGCLPKVVLQPLEETPDGL